MTPAAPSARRRRAVSTVVDASVFLLLVSAAVGTLYLPVGASGGDRPPAPAAASTAEALATGTVAVPYALDTGRLPDGADRRRSDPPAVERLDDGVTDRIRVRPAALAADIVGADGPSPETRRVAHGTHAGLLAEAAVENATLDGAPLSTASDGFEQRVAAAVRNATRASGGRTRVRAVWTPYPGAPVRGVAVAGPRPPPDAAVAAATVRVPSRFPRSRDRALRAARRDGYAGVARVVAGATVTGWFPPSETRLALRGDHPVDALVTRRYRRTADLLGTSVGNPVAAVEPRRANDRIETALARRLERDLRGAYDTPAAAARAVRVGTVRVVVRTW